MARREVLVVEDNGAAADLAKHMLGKLGFHARVVETAEDALSALRKHRPDLVLVDVQLPGMNGFEAARKWRKCRIDILTAHRSSSCLRTNTTQRNLGARIRWWRDICRSLSTGSFLATLTAHAVQNNQGAVLQIEVD